MSFPSNNSTLPEKLTLLVKYVMRGFYQPEQFIIVDYLIRNPCVKEDDIIQLLHFERKQLRLYLASLRNDRFLKQKLRVETVEGGKAVRHNYYYVDYHSFLNMVKYKLLMMQKRIDSQARDSSNRAKYVCSGCERTYNELDVGQLFDPMTNEMCCVICGHVVEEDESIDPQQDLGISVKFHEQCKKMFDLLDNVEKDGLPKKISEPQFNDITTFINKINNPSQPTAPSLNGDADDASKLWSGDKQKSQYNLYADDGGVRVSIEGVTDTGDNNDAMPGKREMPPWMVVSTVDGRPIHPDRSDGLVSHQDQKSGSRGSGMRDDVYRLPPLQELEQMLIANEHKLIPKSNTPRSATNQHKTHPSSAPPQQPTSSPVDTCQHSITFSVGGSRVPLIKLVEEDLRRMSDKERVEFVRVSNQLYLNLYD